jgi:hypothetical protein
MLVPNMTNNYKFGEFSKVDLLNAEAAGEPIFKVNEQLSYDKDNGPLNQYNYLEDFFTFRWRKVYTVRQYIPRHQPNKNDINKNFIGFKNISDGVGVNKLPFNRLFTKINPIYSILCFLLTLFAFIVGEINLFIQVINALISNICEIPIRVPCIRLAFDVGKVKFNKKAKTSHFLKTTYTDNVACRANSGDTTNNLTTVIGEFSECVPASEDVTPNNPANPFGENCNASNGKIYRSELISSTTITEDCEPDGGACIECKETCLTCDEEGKTAAAPCSEDTTDTTLGGVSFGVLGACIRVCYHFDFNITRICPVKGLCNTCSNDEDYCGTSDDCDKPDYAGEFRYKWERPDKTEQGKCLNRAVFTTPNTLPAACDDLGLSVTTSYFTKVGSKRGKTFTGCEELEEQEENEEIEFDTLTQDQIDDANGTASTDALNNLDEETIDVFECDTVEGDKPCSCKKGDKIEGVSIGCLRALGYSKDELYNGKPINVRGDEKCAVNGGAGKGINQHCCNGCRDCKSCEDGECPKNCLATCCEKIPLIQLSCPEEGSIKPQSRAVGRCAGDIIQRCENCSGVYYSNISNWVACRLESVATFFNMLDFEFYNDWMNGSLYFPLIKRKLKIKRAKKAAKGKSLRRGQGQVKKDVFCDYDCDGGNNEPDYQFPDDVELYSVKIRGGGKVDLTLKGCKATLPRRITAKKWYDDVNKVYRTIEFKGNDEEDISKGCTFTLEEYCDSNTDGVNCPTGETDNDGVQIGNTGKFIKVKKRIVPGPHGKPKYIQIGAGSDGDGKRISIWENVGGHGHHKNKCKKNYFIEKEEYTKTDLSDCGAPISESGTPEDIPIGSGIDSDSADSEKCALSCAGQGTAACKKNKDGCVCDEGGYNEDPNYRGIVKWEEGELYYVSIKDNRDSEEDKSDNNNGSATGFGGKGNFDETHYKKNMFFPTNITELGSSVFCDIDEAPFILDELEPTTYKVSEEELKVTKNNATNINADFSLKEKEGNINLRSYVDFGCTGMRCMNVRSSVVQSQVGTELFDTNDTGLECGSCKSYVDVDTDIRQYFCQRFSTFVPSVSTDGNTIIDMKVNYMRPGGSQGENYYEPYNAITGRCDSFEGKTAIVDGGVTNDDVINIDNEVNDNDPITPGDKCGYLTNLDFKDVKYFYAMDLTEEHTKQDLKSFPFDESKLGSDYEGSIDLQQNPILVDDDEGISLFSTQTPYFFYFGLVPGKTALNKVVGKFFADKIDAETLNSDNNDDDTPPPPNNTNVPPNNNKATSPQSIVGSCVNS